MRLPWTLPSRTKAAVVSVLSASLVAVPALSRVDPARISGPTAERDHDARGSSAAPSGLQVTSTVTAPRRRASREGRAHEGRHAARRHAHHDVAAPRPAPHLPRPVRGVVLRAFHGRGTPTPARPPSPPGRARAACRRSAGIPRPRAPRAGRSCRRPRRRAGRPRASPRHDELHGPRERRAPRGPPRAPRARSARFMSRAMASGESRSRRRLRGVRPLGGQARRSESSAWAGAPILLL